MARVLLALSIAVLVGACARDASFREAQAMWQSRLPHAYATWRAAALHDDEARGRLAESARVYASGVAAFERGDADATEQLRHGAEIAPIDPALYLRLARACRQQGAFVRAADFYKKLLVEDPGSAIARSELAQIDREIGDPFVAPSETDRRWWPLGVLALAPFVFVSFVVLRRRHLDVAQVLDAHPERAAAFAYQAGILRHELIKHQLAPWRSGRGGDPLAVRATWRLHLESLGLTLGLARGWFRREPAFAAADDAIGRLEHGDLRAIDALERELVAWVRLARHTRIDEGLLGRLVESLRDELPGGLGVELEVCALESPTAAIFEHDLLLVARNLTRNAIVASREAGGRVRVEVSLHLDDAAHEWVRIAVHDGHPSRPDARASADRGLGIVRATLERYGGALVDGVPSAGYAKALVASVPAAEEPAIDAAQHERRAA